MWSLRVFLCTVLLSVSVHGYNISAANWTIFGADEVSAVEGASAVLPCRFTHPPTDRNLTGSVLWHNKLPPWPPNLVFNCTYPSHGPFRCDEVTQEAGSRFKFVGNLREGDASIMVEPLRRVDRDKYRCRVDLNVGSFQSLIPTQLTVEDLDGDVSVVNGTEGGSATLPCVYRQSPHYPNALTVTWMRKDPYRHFVTFRHQAGGSWAAENGATRFELVGDPELGNASTRIKQLSVEDSGGYLCLVEFNKTENNAINDVAKGFKNSVHPPFTHQYQREVQLQVTPGPSNPLNYILPILILLLMLCILLIIILWKKGVFSSVMGSVRFSKGSAASPDDTGRGAQLQCDSDQAESCTYASIKDSSGKVKNPQTDDEDQAESCTYASIVINSGKEKKPQADDGGGQKPEAENSEVIYSAVVTSR
ncbi:uncharacterized protein LOC129695285 isoform X2 [Leucoraja erinacea]|uniref:uncharacterized protein LOC129695285 isoform X2 n=1 Tax=Leucoraja erinaceus TaxID=7782 RepID=UPI002457D4C8|nr:uncharacterized protein LOC129695285 isoform X2 [Leucoraja erinacea]